MIPVITAIVGVVAGFVINGIRQSRTRASHEVMLTGRRDKRRHEISENISVLARKKRRRIEGKHGAIIARLRRDQEKWASRRARQEIRRERVTTHSDEIDSGFGVVRKRRKSTKDRGRHCRRLADQLREVLTAQREAVREHVGIDIEALRTEVLESYTTEVQHERARWLRNHTETVETERHDLAEDMIDLLIGRLQLKATVRPPDHRIQIKDKAFPKKVLVPDSPVLTQVAELCKVEFFFDESGETVTASAFDGVARELAVRLIEKILRDRKDKPEWIVEQHEAVTRRLEREMTRSAGDLLRRMKINDIPVEIVRLQGRTKYRTSFGQNVLDHQLEVGYLCGMMGDELGGFKRTTARHCGFFHDIGKAIDVVQEGSHPQLGGDFLTEHKDDADVILACYHHHDPFNPEQILTAITTSCDAVSAGRPGARRESIDSYVERVESLEKIARGPKEATNVAVMQAGREIQVNVNPKSTSDEDLKEIADKLASQIEEELVYPGEIRVNIVRETQVKVVAR